jgi:hypothetical protein
MSARINGGADGVMIGAATRLECLRLALDHARLRPTAFPSCGCACARGRRFRFGRVHRPNGEFGPYPRRWVSTAVDSHPHDSAAK